MDSTSQFDKDEMDIIAQAQREQAEVDAAMLAEAQAAEAAEAAAAGAQEGQTTTAAAPVPAPAPAEAAPAEAPAAQTPDTSAAPAAAAPATAAAPAVAAGDLRPALRASRRDARKLSAELAHVRKELDEVKARTTQPGADTIARPSEEVLRDVEAYAGPAAEYIKQLERRNDELSKQAKNAPPAPTTAQPAFVPEEIPDAALQEAVDSIDELSDWQNSAQHVDLWEAAKRVDDVLAVMPAWKGKSDRDRLEEVVRRVKQDFSASPTPAPKAPATAADAARVIEAIPAQSAPVTLGDMRGGTTPSLSTTPDFRKMVRDGMTDEEIMASLGP